MCFNCCRVVIGKSLSVSLSLWTCYLGIIMFFYCSRCKVLGTCSRDGPVLNSTLLRLVIAKKYSFLLPFDGMFNLQYRKIQLQLCVVKIFNRKSATS